MLQILFSLLYVKFILFSSYRSVGFEENIRYAKKRSYCTSAIWNAAIEVAAFTFGTRQLRLWLLCKFISPEATVINLFAILRVFLVGLISQLK